MGNDLYVGDKASAIADEDDLGDKAIAIAGDNDVYVGKRVIGIADGLKRVLASVTNGHVVYGGSAKVWGYTDASYDLGVWGVCTLLGCPNGVIQLLGVRTADTIGHLRVESVPQLCNAVVHRCEAALHMETPRARL